VLNMPEALVDIPLNASGFSFSWKAF
jgi:hypothetical protein